jgi:hypothetical protein
LQTSNQKGTAVIDASTITKLAGSQANIRLTITNFLGLSAQANIILSFSGNEGIVLNDVMESYTINPANDFKFNPSLNISNCNFTSTSIRRVQRFKVLCTI